MRTRPKFLTVLCVLSGAAAIYGIFVGLSNALSPPEVDSEFVDNLLARLNAFDLPMGNLEQYMEDFYVNLMINMGNVGTANFLFYGIQLVGVYLMLRMNRIGFVLYVVAQLGLSFTLTVFGGFNSFGKMMLAMSLFWSTVWIIAYATQLKHFPTWHRAR